MLSAVCRVPCNMLEIQQWTGQAWSLRTGNLASGERRTAACRSDCLTEAVKMLQEKERMLWGLLGKQGFPKAAVFPGQRCHRPAAGAPRVCGAAGEGGELHSCLCGSRDTVLCARGDLFGWPSSERQCQFVLALLTLLGSQVSRTEYLTQYVLDEW